MSSRKTILRDNQDELSLIILKVLTLEQFIL